MLDIYFASGNPHKVLEINEIAHPYGVNAKLPEGKFDPDETGSTYEENSFIKAYEASKCCGGEADLFLADDSGLEIYALNNAPGLKSARYAPTAEDRINRVLSSLLLVLVVLSLVSYYFVSDSQKTMNNLTKQIVTLNNENIELQNKLDNLHSFNRVDAVIQHNNTLDTAKKVIEIPAVNMVNVPKVPSMPVNYNWSIGY